MAITGISSHDGDFGGSGAGIMPAQIRASKSFKVAASIMLRVNAKSTSLTVGGKGVYYARYVAFLTLALALAGCANTATTHLSSIAPNRPNTASPASASPSIAPRSSAQATCSGSAAVLTARMEAAGLPIRELIVYDAATDPNHLLGRQDEYTSKDAWMDPAAVAAGAGNPSSDPGGTEFGGGIEAFPSVADAQARLAYLKAFQPPIGDGYDYLAGSAILRLSNYLTPAEAAQFHAAFDTDGCMKS
jgi:hypothetical protein